MDFDISNTQPYVDWLSDIVSSEGRLLDELSFVFCSDPFLLDLNINYLKHKAYTDIITFDYSKSNTISGEVYISIDRVRENANLYDVSFNVELHRVLAHGVLHLCGYTDKTANEKAIMRAREDYYMARFK
jgi:rRNA maturation RNase YbeY